jgi:hypothetical protein
VTGSEIETRIIGESTEKSAIMIEIGTETEKEIMESEEIVNETENGEGRVDVAAMIETKTEIEIAMQMARNDDGRKT